MGEGRGGEGAATAAADIRQLCDPAHMHVGPVWILPTCMLALYEPCPHACRPCMDPAHMHAGPV